MDFAKFIALLESRALRFSRYDQFADPFEGLLSKPTLDSYRDAGGFKDDPAMFAQFERWMRRLGKKYAYASCWNSGQHERAGLWGVYVGSTPGVAIQTTTQRLAQCFLDGPDRDVITISHVRYGDLSTLAMERDNVWRPITYKDVCYEDEHEVRAIYIDPRYIRESAIDGPKPPRQTPVGVDAAIDPAVLVERVVVAPSSANWVLDLARAVCVRYGVDAPVESSYLTRGG